MLTFNASDKGIRNANQTLNNSSITQYHDQDYKMAKALVIGDLDNEQSSYDRLLQVSDLITMASVYIFANSVWQIWNKPKYLTRHLYLLVAGTFMYMNYNANRITCNVVEQTKKIKQDLVKDNFETVEQLINEHINPETLAKKTIFACWMINLGFPKRKS